MAMRRFHPKPRVRLEALEKRLLLHAGTDLTDDFALAQQAAAIDFHGPDLTGKDGPMARIGFDLASIFEQQKIHDASHPGTVFLPQTALPLMISGDTIGIDLTGTGDINTLKSNLAAIGMQGIVSAGSLISGTIPISSLDKLAALSSVVLARPGYRPITHAGSVQDQADSALRSDLARSTFGVDGSGVTVGILSDSFNAVPYAGGVDGVARDISTGDLPADTQILSDDSFGTDEGRAMGQLVHDIAPGAAIRFATADGGQATFANNILALANAGSNVIVDDVGYFAEPFFQDGVIAQAVDTVVARGIPYFSAAGNAAADSYESAFVDSGQTGADGRKFHDFDPGPGVATLQQWNVSVFGTVILGFQWDQPFRSLGGAGSTVDIDLSLLGADGTTVLASAVTNNIGGDPMEILGFFNDGSIDLDGVTGADTRFYLRIELVSGSAPGLMKGIDFGDGSSIVTFATDSSTDAGHPNAAGAMGVAASVYLATPAYGTSPPLVNDFSSKGGTPILFDTAGNRLAAPLDRMSPGVTGVDGTNTTFFGDDISLDSDTFPNFFGTSAAAPHVAAVAALMIQATGGPGSVDPRSIYDAMESTAIDIVARIDLGTQLPIPIANAQGFDRFSGYGLVDAVAAIQFISTGITINDVTRLEGTGGFTSFVFTISLAGTPGQPVTVAYATADGSAVAAADYLATSGTLSFVAGGPAVQMVTVQVVADETVEANETFFLRLTVTNARAIRSQGIGTILNDDIDVVDRRHLDRRR